jgi:hypothetical protein
LNVVIFPVFSSDWTPLHSSSWKGHVQVCRLLVQSKADVTVRDGCVPCSIACHRLPLTRCAVGMATLLSNGLSRGTRPTLLHICAAWGRLHELHAVRCAPPVKCCYSPQPPPQSQTLPPPQPPTLLGVFTKRNFTKPFSVILLSFYPLSPLDASFASNYMQKQEQHRLSCATSFNFDKHYKTTPNRHHFLKPNSHFRAAWSDTTSSKTSNTVTRSSGDRSM